MSNPFKFVARTLLRHGKIYGSSLMHMLRSLILGGAHYCFLNPSNKCEQNYARSSQEVPLLFVIDLALAVMPSLSGCLGQ